MSRPCPFCERGRLEMERGYLTCQRCGEQTLEKVEDSVETLEYIADSDLNSAWIAERLLGGR